MKQKKIDDRRGRPMQDGAGGPTNLWAGWGFNAYFMVLLSLYLFTIAAVIFALAVVGLGNKVVGFVLVMFFVIAFAVTLCRMMVRTWEVIRYQHRGFEAATIKEQLPDGKYIYRVNPDVTPEQERDIRQGARSARNALPTLAFIQNFPGIGPANPPADPSQTQASTPKLSIDEVAAIRKELERQLMEDLKKRFEGMMKAPPSENIPTKSNSATKTPPLSTTTRKCRHCGYVGANIGELNKHMRKVHTK